MDFNKVAMSVMGGLFLILITLVVSGMDDRYRASEAHADQARIMAEMRLIESRTKEFIAAHATGGPHDQVESRLVAVEQSNKFLREAIKDIRDDLKRLIRYIGDDDFTSPKSKK
jgi:hypothetical protein